MRTSSGRCDRRESVVGYLAVGTNAVWKGFDLGEVAAAVDAGLKLLLRSRPGMDVVLMDLQYAPAILGDNRIKAAERMVELISDATAANPPVNRFRRFDLMRRWYEIEKNSFDRMIDSSDGDRLHQSDWSAQRIGQSLSEVIVSAAIRPQRQCRDFGIVIIELDSSYMTGMTSCSNVDRFARPERSMAIFAMAVGSNSRT